MIMRKNVKEYDLKPYYLN